LEENGIVKYIRAERIDIVEADGTLRMGLFNSENIPPAMMDGENFLPGHRQGTGLSGILFYNTEGDECGGLVFGSEKREDGSYSSNLSLTFDQYKNDQIVQILTTEENKERSYGFRIYDRPNENLRETVSLYNAINEIENAEEKKQLQAEFDVISAKNVLRMHAGRLKNGNVGVYLYGKDGKPRAKIYVDTNDMPHFELLDSNGNLIKTNNTN
jgi:hypothetical protein